MRKAFNFYRSFYDVYKELNDKQAKEFMDNLLAVEFLEKSIHDVVFTDKMCSIVWSSIKHSIESQIQGYSHKMGIEPPSLPPKVAPAIQGEGQVQEEVEEEGQSNAPQQVATLPKKTKSKSKSKDIHLSDEQEKTFDTIWRNYELDTLVNTLGRSSENKTDVKKLYDGLVNKLNIEPEIIESYVKNTLQSCNELKFLHGLRKIFSDTETFKDLQKGKNENN